MEETKSLQKRVLEELALIAFADFSDHVEVADGAIVIRDTGELKRTQRAAVAAIEKSSAGIKIKLYDKLKALELLGKHLGLFDGSGEAAQSDNGLLEALRQATNKEVSVNEISEIR